MRDTKRKLARKHHLMIGVLAASVAFTFNAEAGVSSDLAKGKTPTQAVSTALASGENPGRISRALTAAGVSRAVAANVVATAPRHSSGSDRHSDGARGRGFDLAAAIAQFKDSHKPGRELARFIAFFKVLAGWHHHPGGPSPC